MFRPESASLRILRYPLLFSFQADQFDQFGILRDFAVYMRRKLFLCVGLRLEAFTVNESFISSVLTTLPITGV